MTRMSTIYSRLSYGTGTALTGCGVSTKAYAGAVKTEVWILADKIAGLPPNVLRRWSQSQSRLPSRGRLSSSKLSRSNTQAQV